MLAQSRPDLNDWIRVAAIALIALVLTVVAQPASATSLADTENDRVWLISTRCITSSACCADLDRPALTVSRLGCNNRFLRVPLDDFLSTIGSSRQVVIYVHGNRMNPSDARLHGVSIYKNCLRHRKSGPVDWVIWSWPSTKAGFLTRDIRKKARRTDAQGLYLAWLLREQSTRSVPTTVIGYSFGSRVVTGALHAMAGGTLGGRSLSGPSISEASIGTGLIAPAIGSHWLSEHGYHSLATQNMRQLVLMYNRRDVILKRYWWIDRVRGRVALGYGCPAIFGPRVDGSQLPVRSRDCTSSLGFAHNELDYFIKGCGAGSEMAKLIDDIQLKR